MDWSSIVQGLLGSLAEAGGSLDFDISSLDELGQYGFLTDQVNKARLQSGTYTPGLYLNQASNDPNLFRKWGHTGLTDEQLQAADIEAMEAQRNRTWQTELAGTEVQRRVADMKAAGVNSALMYGNASSGASTPSGAVGSSGSQGAGMSFGELLSAFMLPLQMRLMRSQIKNTDVKTEGEALKNQYQSLVNGYYPTLTEKTIEQISTSILGEKANINLRDAQTAFQKVQTALEEAKLQYKDDYARLLRDFQEANTDALKAQKAASLARAAVDNCEAAYMKANGQRMGTNDYVALANAICAWLGTDVSSVVTEVVDVVKEKAPKVASDVKSDFSAPFEGDFGEGTSPRVRKFFRHGYDKAKGAYKAVRYGRRR